MGYLNKLLIDLKNDRHYCRLEYLKTDKNCASQFNYADFASLMSQQGYILPVSTLADGLNGQTALFELCGFCDYMFYSLERDFSIRDNETHYDIIRPHEAEYQTKYKNNWFSDNCNIIRVVQKLAEVQSNDHAQRPFHRRNRP